MGVYGKCAHQIKKKKMGVPKKKRWGNAHLFFQIFWPPSFAYPYLGVGFFIGKF